MIKKALPLFMVLAITFFSCKKNDLDYPDTKKTETTDTYFRTEVPDPYRWLENDTAKEVEQWVEAQNELTYNYL